MKRLSALLAAIVIAAAAYAQQLDSAIVAALDTHLDEYFAALDYETIDVKLGECDFMIESCTDSLVRQYVAVRIYDHFLGSKVMGDEAVAVHMVDDWFTPGKVSMYSDLDLLNAQVYAMFHRNSLLGMQAPQLTMRTAAMESETLPRKGDYSILFFYDTACARCKVETMLLREVLQEVTAPVQFYAIYSGINRQQWEEYSAARWDFKAPMVTMHHLWDPELESDFQKLYGVLQTPQMLLVDEDGVIIGRGLDSEALRTLLQHVLPQPYDYGTDMSKSVFGEVYAGDDPTAAHLLEMAEYVKAQCLAKGDSTLCRHMLGDYMYYLMDTPGEEYKTALQAFIVTYVDRDPKLWASPDDQAKVVLPAAIASDLLSRVPVGSRVPNLKVKGRFPGEEALRSKRLRSVKGTPTYLFFGDPFCSACSAEMQGLREVLASELDAKAFLVDPADNDERLLDTLDLSSLPFIIQTDRKGKVLHKYISFL